jgi:hypothetical protein
VTRLLPKSSFFRAGGSVVVERPQGIAGTGRHALPLTAVVEFLLAGTGRQA